MAAETRMTRFLRIRWAGFAHTRHWLRGTALIDYELREDHLPQLREDLNAPNLLLERVEADELRERASIEPSFTGRDVYWCWLLNEPVILKFLNGEFGQCSLCGWTEEREHATTPPNFLGGPGQHTFVCRVFKPTADMWMVEQ